MKENRMKGKKARGQGERGVRNESERKGQKRIVREGYGLSTWKRRRVIALSLKWRLGKEGAKPNSTYYRSGVKLWFAQRGKKEVYRGKRETGGRGRVTRTTRGKATWPR